MKGTLNSCTAAQSHNGEGAGCCHYWLIGEPQGPVSEGVCRKCGEVRQFNNYVEDLILASAAASFYRGKQTEFATSSAPIPP